MAKGPKQSFLTIYSPHYIIYGRASSIVLQSFFVYFSY